MSYAAITKRARSRFESRDWHGMQADAAERLDVYKLVVEQVVANIHTLLRDGVNEKLVWISTKAVYSGLIADCDDYELAETFFNSITRRIFTTVGVDKQIEFVDTDFETPPKKATDTVFHTYNRAKSTALLIEKILNDYQFEIAFENLSRDAALASAIVEKNYGKSERSNTSSARKSSNRYFIAITGRFSSAGYSAAATPFQSHWHCRTSRPA